MEYINDKKISDTEYQRDGAVEGGDVNTFRDDRPEYSRGGRGRRGGAHRSDNWRSDPSGGGGGNRDDNEEYRGGRGGYRGGRGGRGGGRGRGSYNAWTNRETRDEDNASPAAADAAGDRACASNASTAPAPASAPAPAPAPAPAAAPTPASAPVSAPEKAPASLPVETGGFAPPAHERREAVSEPWSREDDRGYGRGGRGGYRSGGRNYDGGFGGRGGRGGRRYYDAEEEGGGGYRRRDYDDGEGEEGGYSRNYDSGYGGGGYRRGGYGGRGGRGGRRYYDDEDDYGEGGDRGGGTGNEDDDYEDGGYDAYRRGGSRWRRGGYGRDYDYDRPRGRGERGGRRDFRSFRNEDDVMEESGGAQGNAWASSPAPTEARTAPQESAPAPATTAGAVALRSAVPDPAKAGEDVTSPAPQQTQSGIRRVTRASHLRRNCHDEAKVMELFEHRHRQTGISLENYDSIPVEMVPRDVKPVEDFADLLVEPALAANIERCGYKKPTPVQRYGIPVALSGSDLMACAQTGSGKTAAFLIPVVQYMLVHGVSPARQRKSYPIALVLAPTRELAVQIFDEVRKLTFNTDIFYDVVYGGTRYPQRFEQDILVACPGRLRDMFNEEYLSFSAIKFLILDEADRMLEMGFEEQIEELVASRYTDMPTVDERQTFMFSATFPQRILNLAKRYLRRKYYLLTVGRVGSTTKNITQTIEHVPDNEKMDRLLQIIYGHEMSDMVLIFVETKKMAEDVNRRLHREGISSTTIHGDRRQQDREAALEDFKQKVTPILVATDVASRGLDIPDVAHVVQFDLPQEMDDYTHRIGRTGRAGNKGIATAFYNRNNRRLALDLHKYFSEHGQEIPKWFQQEAELVEGEALLSRDMGGGGRRRGGGGGGGGGGHRSGGPGGRGGGGGSWGDSRPSAPSGGGRRGGGVDDGGF
ncbi:putative ATP-dependent RNA helicase [Leishmania infantum JPCM5]|uniref:Probable eukaryotic initiation factor 4A n=2 Tax=Leishmania infantum TaxID=5671 RepID=A4IBK1_LEIIN|nr:putative ATP-dependent RNA helicase [Leishmania infantum JPCM5]CAC9545586.1 ATP-dependent_RNA_helicase_-_putative [Leishmania infantum]CAM72220.1 putative ATP-dependent RNA helicase [Leishmania infantum JPCM5]SUZ46139.1 ATP-dependent_RNA_helicase_-_putative [Leishmania infantum]|eukprot:XP_001469120.1 putative ATP-dependent RNA helicase [Leishmania infantum JPCM5]